MKWDRRTFLQTLLTWGVGQGSLGWLNNRNKLDQYYQTLAEPTHRKLALLVGINDYAEGFNLKGCLTDVERQRELLIYRFGFQPQDILTLTGKQATRQGIETAFLEHLVTQAKAGDVVIFHFSGYGNYVKVSPEVALTVTEGQLRGLIPRDGILLNEGNPTTDNILEDTLILLGRSLATEKLTLVLDTSYHLGSQPLPSNLRLRSFPYTAGQVNPEELAFQTQLKSQLKKNSPRDQALAMPGMILSAAGNKQIAAEIKGNGFSAGLFTYALTQYLWEISTPSQVSVTLNKTREQIIPILGERQQPQKSNNAKQPLFTYYLLPTINQGAEAVINGIEDDSTATVKLTGLRAPILQYYGLNSCFRLLSSPSVLLQLRSREGLKGKVRYLNPEQAPQHPLEVGQFLQETIRCLPQTLGLTVALDQGLQRIERVDATSAFSAIDFVSSVITSGEQAADCVLGVKSSSTPPPEASDSDPTVLEQYGLFLPGGVPLPNTLGKSGEAIKSAVERLTPTLERVLAAKLWGLTLNQGSSQLPWVVTLEGLAPNPQPLAQCQTTRRAGANPSLEPPEEMLTALATVSPEADGLPQVARGSRLQYRLENRGDKSLYYLIVGIDSRGQAIAYIPQFNATGTEEENLAVIAPDATKIVPSSASGLTWTVSQTQGWEQILVIASLSPFEETLKAWQKSPGFKANTVQILTLKNPLEIAQCLLQDLNAASAVKSELLDTNPDSYALDVRAWSTLSFVYQVI
ncbi:caspase family protein [Crocosphaera sp. XPORK-15E]|uniref:caspase family protein n=1 Tax=Crocosphaera sp. XPORK-15E TaxID=3110247 RepID=UPI002B1F2A33|nr:caspase family protein [Crocosphaera sp. XPORK-15E]MEA5536742.1 caspase family protein [Crocosphaera sp. XPORK-15E]